MLKVILGKKKGEVVAKKLNCGDSSALTNEVQISPRLFLSEEQISVLLYTVLMVLRLGGIMSICQENKKEISKGFTQCRTQQVSSILKEEGMLQYFYHSPSSKIPIRDVLGENMIDSHSVGRKTEPHLEIGAENYIRRCWARNISRFIEENKKYLFLLTVCKNKDPGQIILGSHLLSVSSKSRQLGNLTLTMKTENSLKGQLSFLNLRTQSLIQAFLEKTIEEGQVSCITCGLTRKKLAK